MGRTDGQQLQAGTERDVDVAERMVPWRQENRGVGLWPSAIRNALGVEVVVHDGGKTYELARNGGGAGRDSGRVPRAGRHTGSRREPA